MVASALDQTNSHQESAADGNVVRESRRLSRWFFILVLFICFIIIVGGVVRLSGSGLSIPEWPIINGSLLPPFNDDGWVTVYNTYYDKIHGMQVSGPDDANHSNLLDLSKFKIMFAIEYFHRLVAALLGIIFLVLAIQTFKQPVLKPLLKRRLIGLGVLLVAQAVLGGIVVKLDLRAEFVAVHLGIAFVLLGMLLWTAMQLSRGPNDFNLPPSKQCTLLNLAWLSMAAVYIQIIGGGMVAAMHAGRFYNTWPKMGENFLPPAVALWSDQYVPAILNVVQNPVFIQFFHRWWAMVAALMVFIMIGASFRTKLNHSSRLAMRFLASTVVLQILLGITTLVAKVPFAIALIHQMVGVLLFCCLIFLTYGLRRHV